MPQTELQFFYSGATTFTIAVYLLWRAKSRLWRVIAAALLLIGLQLFFGSIDIDFAHRRTSTCDATIR